MGSPVDLTLGRCSSSSSNGYNGRSSTCPSEERTLLTLKEERRKVEGFKRELPLSIQLLDDAIKAAEARLASIVHGKGKGIVQPTALRLPRSVENEIGGELSPECRRPTLEEFMPLTRQAEHEEQPSVLTSDGERGIHPPPWMAETHLWNSQSTADERMRDAGQSEQEQSSVTSSQQGAGAFSPFQLQQPVAVVSRPKPRSGGFCADLNLSVAGTSLRTSSDVEIGSNGVDSSVATATAATKQLAPPPSSAPDAQTMCKDAASAAAARKARRCWSPELHRRFVTALQQLGGSHIATPKQLRELMKVDGLTNDEVKSHLQKYRLHTRRPSPSPSPHTSAAAAAAAAAAAGAPAGAPQLVVVGGIWMPPSAGANSQPGSQSGVTDGSQFGSLPRLDYFAACINSNGTSAAAAAAAAGPAAPMQMLQLHRQPIFEAPPQAAGTAQSQTSPQGPLQVTSQLSGATQGSSSDSYESGEEEARSQGTSWKLGQQREHRPLVTAELAEPKNLDVKTTQQVPSNAPQPQ